MGNELLHVMAALRCEKSRIVEQAGMDFVVLMESPSHD